MIHFNIDSSDSSDENMGAQSFKTTLNPNLNYLNLMTPLLFVPYSVIRHLVPQLEEKKVAHLFVVKRGFGSFKTSKEKEDPSRMRSNNNELDLGTEQQASTNHTRMFKVSKRKV